MASSRKTGTNEQVSTYGASGQGRDYTSLATWEAATDYDLVTAAKSEVLECYDDQASFDDGVLMTGATCNASYFRIVRPASGQGHDGTPNNGVTFALANANNVFKIGAEAYSQVQDIIAKINATASLSKYVFNTATGAEAGIVGCIAYDSRNAGAGNWYGFGVSQGHVVNCLAHNCDVGFLQINNLADNQTGVFYNCTAEGCAYGFYNNAATGTGRVVKWTNCLADNSDYSDFYKNGTLSPTVSYCASGDATADDWGGSGNRINQTFSFVDAASDDFHLSSSDTGAKDYGTDLSSDSDYAFNDDIDNDTRSGSWDIGFDEVLGGQSYNVDTTDVFKSSDSINSKLAAVASGTDVFKSTDTQSGVGSFPRDTADVFKSTDSPSGSRGQLGLVTDAFKSTDSPGGKAAMMGSIIDIAKLIDTINSKLGAINTATDIFKSTDSPYGPASFLRDTSDHFKVTDAPGGRLAVLGTATDLLKLVDSPSSKVALVGTPSDIFKLIDSPGGVVALLGAVSDTLQVTDSSSSILALTVTLTDIFKLIDQADTSRHFVVDITDVISMTDLSSAPAQLLGTITDIINAQDFPSSKVAFLVTLADLAKFTDSSSAPLQLLAVRNNGLLTKVYIWR